MDDGGQEVDVADDAADGGAARTPRRRGLAAWLFERRPERASTPPAPAAVAAPPVPDLGESGEQDDFDAAQPTADPAPVHAERPKPAPVPRPEPEAQPAAEAQPEPAAEPQESGSCADTPPIPGASAQDREVSPEPETQPEAETKSAAEAQPEAEAQAEAEPEPEIQPEPVAGRKARPRPSGSSPKIYEPAAATASEDEVAQKVAQSAFFDRPIDDDDEKWHKDADKDEDRAAREQKRKDRRAAVGRALRTLRKLVIIVGVAVVAALLLRNYVVSPYYVPSASMEPTLHGCPGCNNDHVLVEKLSYRFHDVQAGDVIVFHRPDTWKVPDDVLIKRVIGVAGDRLTIRNGRVFRNGQVLSESYVNQDCKPATTAMPGSTSRAAKTFPDVPKGDVFVMGDNRCDSEDSRVFGVVPTDKVIGRAFLIVYPFGRFHSLSD